MTADTTTIIFGPPGTGKTTDLIRIAEEEIGKGVPPREIAFVSFTRRAAHEAKSRAMAKFSLQPDDLPWFRTLHSFAFIRMGLTKQQIMSFRDYLTICSMLGLSITFRGIEEDGTMGGLSRGDRLFFMENMARTLGVPLEQYWETQPDEDVNWHELLQLNKTLLQYKETNDKRDFTDVIHAFVNEPRVPECRILIVDEAQDLSPIQWKMVQTIGQYAEHCYIAGDDDQSIFRWAGADVDHLIRLEGTRRVLPKSYRVPPAVQLYAESIIGRVSSRVPKSWEPRSLGAEASATEFIGGVDQLDLSKGSWMLLARNTYLLSSYVEHCLREGLVFTSTTGSPISGEALRAIRIWESLRRGDRIALDNVKLVYGYLSPKVGVSHGAKTGLNRLPDQATLTLNELRSTHGLLTDKIWHVALDKLSQEEVLYFLTALKRGEKLNQEPRIRISTIHGVKGGEADNVVIQLDMAARTFDEYQRNPDDEHRVWYVAVTRARHCLYIIPGQTTRCYEI